jgi:hypothetical protein
MDETQERAMSGFGDVAKIVQVLNQHQTSLAADAGRRMEHDIGQVNRVLLQYKPYTKRIRAIGKATAIKA